MDLIGSTRRSVATIVQVAAMYVALETVGGLLTTTLAAAGIVYGFTQLIARLRRSDTPVRNVDHKT